MNRYFSWFGLPGTVVLTALLSLMALIMLILFPTESRFWCLLAMLLSSMGDIVLGGFQKINKRIPFPPIYLGALLFGAAHLFYTFGYLKQHQVIGEPYWNFGSYIALVIVLFCASVVLYLGWKRNNLKLGLLIMGLLYIAVIGINCITVSAFSWSHAGIKSFASVGALLFYLSDILIGLNLISGLNEKWISEGIWWLYPIGQIILTLCG